MAQIAIASMSWIEGSPNPLRVWPATGSKKLSLKPAWIPMTYTGLVATQNSTPPEEISDIKHQRDKRQYRAMVYFAVQVDPRNPIQDEYEYVGETILSPGYTPPFNIWRVPGGIIDPQARGSWWSGEFQAGELNTQSAIVQNRLHPNSTLELADADHPLASAMIKFRAGKATDDLGIKTVGSPFHVPWVWCELAVTFSAHSGYKLYGRGSKFPSHKWYASEGNELQQKFKVAEAGDSKFSIKPNTKDEIDANLLTLMPILSAGAGRNVAQTPVNQDSGSIDPVTSHGNTAQGGEQFVVKIATPR